jgi:anti-sigma B factor antagonist
MNVDRWALVSNIEGIVVRIEGDLDLANSRDLGSCLSNLIHAGQRTEIDLSGVEFIDSNGLKALIEAHRRAVELGAELVLVAPAGPVRRLFELTGCIDIFTVIPGPADLPDRAEAAH